MDARRRGDGGGCLPSALSIGLWSASLPAALLAAAMIWCWRDSMAEALLAAAAVAIGPWALSADDRAIADGAEIGGALLIRAAGRIASLIAIVIYAVGAWMNHSWQGLVWATPLLALPAGWVVVRVGIKSHRHASGGAGDVRNNAKVRSWPGNLGAATHAIAIPALAALVTVKINLFEDASIWPILLVLLLSDDGRWLAAFLGAMLPGGRSGLRTMRLTLGSMAAGPTQLAVAALGAHTLAIPGRMVLALALGSALIAATAPARRGMARRLAHAEHELDDADQP